MCLLRNSILINKALRSRSEAPACGITEHHPFIFNVEGIVDETFHYYKERLNIVPKNYNLQALVVIMFSVGVSMYMAAGSRCDKLLLVRHESFMLPFSLRTSAVLHIRASCTRGLASWFLIIVSTDYKSLSELIHYCLSSLSLSDDSLQASTMR